MKLDKTILNLTLTEFNQAIIKNLGNEVWRKINNDLDTSCVLVVGGREIYKMMVYNYLVDNGYIENNV
ncbi:hypothetical protein [Paraclostridium bifermentans]|uniref:hypothetical protein n=1 Tax=Paraclostridium bifermentans TaxID=1490 RepID=UPI00189FDAED|nr:hypothetical protein [Paraclostridium bifermentans]